MGRPRASAPVSQPASATTARPARPGIGATTTMTLQEQLAAQMTKLKSVDQAEI